MAGGGDVVGTFAEVADDLAGAPEESPAGECDANADAVTVEEGCAETIFEIVDAAADGGRLDADGPRSTEAAMLGRGNEILEMTNLN